MSIYKMNLQNDCNHYENLNFANVFFFFFLTHIVVVEFYNKTNKHKP